MTTAAVVVRWRGGDEVDRCLRSLLDRSGPVLDRIVLVDSGSGDGGAERLAAAFPEIEVVALTENRSFAHAANAGVRSTTEDFLLLLNPDTELGDHDAAILVEALAGRPRTAGVVPVLQNLNGTSQHRWQLRRLPTVPRLAVGLPGAPAFASSPAAVVPVDQPAAAVWLLRRKVWQALGGLDEAFAPAWWEDVDFCARLTARLGETDLPVEEGFVVVPRATIRHRGGSSLRDLDPTTFLTAYSGNLLRYAARHHPERGSLIRCGLRLSLAARAVLRPRRAGAYLTARRSI